MTPEMAIRFEKAFGSTADTWLRMQVNYDLAQARRHASEIVIERLTPKVALRPDCKTRLRLQIGSSTNCRLGTEALSPPVLKADLGGLSNSCMPPEKGGT